MTEGEWSSIGGEEMITSLIQGAISSAVIARQEGTDKFKKEIGFSLHLIVGGFVQALAILWGMNPIQAFEECLETCKEEFDPAEWEYIVNAWLASWTMENHAELRERYREMMEREES